MNKETIKVTLTISLLAVLLPLSLKAHAADDEPFSWKACLNVANATQGTLTLDKDHTKTLSIMQWDNIIEYGLPPSKIDANENDTVCGTAFEATILPIGANIHFEVTYNIHDALDKQLGRCTVNYDSDYYLRTHPSIASSCDDANHASTVYVLEDYTAVFFNPGLSACPEDLQKTSLYTAVNTTDRNLVITELGGWNRSKKGFQRHNPKINEYLGSKSYQLAVSALTVPPKGQFYVQTCASDYGVTQTDGSLFVAYKMQDPKTKQMGKDTIITFSGSGIPDENNRNSWSTRKVGISYSPYANGAIRSLKIPGLLIYGDAPPN